MTPELLGIHPVSFDDAASVRENDVPFDRGFPRFIIADN